LVGPAADGVLPEPARPGPASPGAEGMEPRADEAGGGAGIFPSIATSVSFRDAGGGLCEPSPLEDGMLGRFLTLSASSFSEGRREDGGFGVSSDIVRPFLS